MVIKNHFTGDPLKVELIDLPFYPRQRFRVRVNGQWARKIPVARLRIAPARQASKTFVTKQVRGWLVKH